MILYNFRDVLKDVKKALSTIPRMSIFSCLKVLSISFNDRTINKTLHMTESTIMQSRSALNKDEIKFPYHLWKIKNIHAELQSAIE